MSDSIDYLGADAYSHNTDPHSVAVARLAGVLAIRDSIVETRRHRPDSFPAVWRNPDAEGTVRRLVAELLDLGWEPPSGDDIATAVARLATGYYATNGAAR